MATIIDSIRERLSADTLTGLATERVKAKVLTLKTERLLELLHQEATIEADFVRGDEEARAKDLADAERRIVAARDEGRGSFGDPDFDCSKGPAAVTHAERFAARRGEYGIGANYLAARFVLEACRDRLAAIRAELARRYAREAPKTLIELRATIAKAKAAEWPFVKTLKDVREQYRMMGGVHGGADESPVQEAARQLGEAEAKTAALRRRLFEEWGVEK